MLSKEIKPHLVTFGIGAGYRRSARRLVSQAKASNLFELCLSYSEENFHNKLPSTQQSINKIVSITDLTLGFGLWYWKPDVILSAMSQVPENEIVVYLDAGCTLNLKNTEAIERFFNYVELASRHGLFAMQLWDGEFDQPDLTDRFWGFSELNDLLKIDDTQLSTNQIQAGILFVKNCQKTRLFLEEWRSIMARDNFRYLVGPSNKSYRYDQSVFSLLYKLGNYPTIPDETYFYPYWKLEGDRFPIWATRIKDGVDPFRCNARDLIYRIERKFIKFKSFCSGHAL
jgi:hypothetical protein